MKQILFRDELIKHLKCILCKCPYGFKTKADKNGTKPELLLQQEILGKLPNDYLKEDNVEIDLAKEDISNTLGEDKWYVDLSFKKDGLYCFIEVKYDEEYQDGKILKSTNPQSEDEVLRDAYKLQCLNGKYNNIVSLIIIATNKSSHWKNFASIPSGERKMVYNGKQEKFTLLKSRDIFWNEAMNSRYKYCIVSID